MGHSQLLTFLLISSLLLSSSLPQGYGRRIKVVRHYSMEKVWNGREMEEMVEDYKQPGPNTNPKSGAPPSPTQSLLN